MEWELWPKRVPQNLARYVTLEVERYLRLPLNTYDAGKNYLAIIEDIYNGLRKKNIRYVPEHYHPAEKLQRIFTPHEIFEAPGTGNCLDLAICFCGLCLSNGLLPILIVLEDHALAAVSLRHSIREWDGYRQARSLFDTYPLSDVTKLCKLIDESGYLVIECTGFANSARLGQNPDARYPETIGRENGVLPFERAREAGLEQLKLKETRPLQFALDIAVAHFAWGLVPYSCDNRQKPVRNLYQPSHGTTSRPLQSLNPNFLPNTFFPLTNTECPVVDTRPCIFVSHDAVGDTSAKDVLNNILHALKEADFVVVLDTQRPSSFSEEWRKQLYICIQQCHGAVVVFSESALTSEWVAYEVNMLNVRKYLNPKFVITPILLPSVTQDQLAKYHFSGDVLLALQEITKDSTIASIIEQQFGPLKSILPENPLQKLGGVITPWLNKLDRATIESVALELHANTISWPQDSESRKMLLAQELLKAELLDVHNAMIELAPKLEQKHAEHIVTILAPSWIDERAVAPIPKLVKRPLIRRTMCLNSEEPLTAEMYIRRACNAFPGWQKPIKALNTSGEDLFEAVERQILAGYRKTFVDDDASDAYIKKQLGIPRTKIEPYIVLIHGELDREILRMLRTKYLGVTFFLLSSDESIDEQELEQNDIELLLPLLDHLEEDDAHSIYWAIRKVVKDSFSY